MDVVMDLSDAYSSGDISPINQLAFAIASQIDEAYMEGHEEAIEEEERVKQSMFLMMHPGLGNS